MQPRERVLAAVARRPVDRVPLHCWLFWLEQFPEIERRFGTVRDFYERLRLDLVQTFPTEPLLPDKLINEHIPSPGDGAPTAGPADGAALGPPYTLTEALETPFADPDEADLYAWVGDDIRHHKGVHGRAVFAQVPGVFESAAGMIGLEAVLGGLIDTPDLVSGLFDKIGRWGRRYSSNAIDLGVDVVHISDDWGSNRGLFMSPRMLAERIIPHDALIAEKAAQRNVPVSLHSEGVVCQAMESILQMGVAVLHPIARPGNMAPAEFKARFGDKLCLCGGLDVQATLGRGDLDAVRRDVIEVMQQLKPGGGFIFCTSHMPPPACTVDELIAAYDCAYELATY